jgi:hypothetical protein
VFRADCSPGEGFECDVGCCTCCGGATQICGPDSNILIDTTSDRYVESGIPEELEKSALKRNATFSTIPNFDPRARALDWILYTDDMQLEATDLNLIQRYTLAVMAFQLDYTVWNNEPNSTSNDTADDDAGAMSDEVINWLTGEDVCEWYGVKCTDGTVTEIHLCEFNCNCGDLSILLIDHILTYLLFYQS